MSEALRDSLEKKRELMFELEITTGSGAAPNIQHISVASIVDDDGTISYDLLRSFVLSLAFPEWQGEAASFDDFLVVTTYKDKDDDCITLSTNEEIEDVTDQCMHEQIISPVRLKVVVECEQHSRKSEVLDSNTNARDGKVAKTTDEEVGGGKNVVTVFFSAPLECCRYPGLQDFTMERESLWKSFERASVDIDVVFDTATVPRVQAALEKKCTSFHFSGHGDEDFLHFEDGPFGIVGIETLVGVAGGDPIEFVFVATNNARGAGERFVQAGVPHVVCCETGDSDSRTAVLAFTETFYTSIATGQTVQDSFDHARSDNEGMKCVSTLLPRSGDHRVPIFRAESIPEWPAKLHQDCDRADESHYRNMMSACPSPLPPQVFVGRELQMIMAMHALKDDRLISIVGERGIGKSAFVYALCHYVNERRSTVTAVERIYCLPPNKVKDFESLIKSLLAQLAEAGRVKLPLPESHTDVLIETICRSLKSEKALIVVDQSDFFVDSDQTDEFMLFMNLLLQDTLNVKVLVTSYHPLYPVDDEVENVIQLEPLDFGSSMRLFAHVYPRFRTCRSEQEFCDRMMLVRSEEKKPFKVKSKSVLIFEAIGDGYPTLIQEAARRIEGNMLERLVGLVTGSEDVEPVTRLEEVEPVAGSEEVEVVTASYEVEPAIEAVGHVTVSEEEIFSFIMGGFV